jgi:hypothetical protein
MDRTEYKRQHYLRNKEKYYEASCKRREEKRKYVRNYKDRPCMKCNNEFPFYVMDLHHRDRMDKETRINNLVQNAGWPALIAELEKCDVLCANCHRIVTYEEKHHLSKA